MIQKICHAQTLLSARVRNSLSYGVKPEKAIGQCLGNCCRCTKIMG